MVTIPTSNKDDFMRQLNSPNTNLPVNMQFEQQVNKIVKNIVISYVSDSAGCGHIRNVFPFTYLNAVFARDGNLIPMIAPFYLYQHDILLRTRSIFFQRQMSPQQIPQIQQYKNLQKNYQYKMVYDIDDFIWKGPNEGECLPEYNFASTQIGEDVRKSSIEIMNMMDTVCVSTQFLKDYLSTHGVNKPIEVVHNTVPKSFWGTVKRGPIKEKIKKPRVVYTGSPTHYCNQRKMVGDWDNAWREWVIKNVKDNKIEFMCMGGLPFFFEEIKNKIHVVKWVNSYQYHLPVIKFRPDFGIAPLVRNYFNYSKSSIKYQEYCAAGCVGIGTVFTNDMPSPYDINIVKAPDTITVDQINQIISEYSEPVKFNDTITKQFKQIEDNNWWLESQGFINRLASLL